MTKEQIRGLSRNFSNHSNVNFPFSRREYRNERIRHVEIRQSVDSLKS